MENKKKEVQALAKYVKMSAHKVRRVINQIRGRSYEDALVLLEFMPYRACSPLLQLVSSAAANASNNLGLRKDILIISEAKVDEASVSKRFQPRAQGRAYSIQKDTCHITIKVREKSK
uniref:Large ribosomal subunit protein uL22c n=1 Tax=Tmesipteris elongata TaxID=50272 RepID=A0A059U7J9_TMEEL|nr:ribosomal protein L22 [Tmesipteris elongata]